jgi:hypothetical protein
LTTNTDDDRFYRPATAPIKPSTVNVGGPYTRLDALFGQRGFTNQIRAEVYPSRAEREQRHEDLERLGRHVGEVRKLEPQTSGACDECVREGFRTSFRFAAFHPACQAVFEFRGRAAKMHVSRVLGEHFWSGRS